MSYNINYHSLKSIGLAPKYFCTKRVKYDKEEKLNLSIVTLSNIFKSNNREN